MMSIRKALARVALALCCAAPGSLAQAQAKYHVGIVTGTVSQSEDEVRAAEFLIKKYGDVKNGGMIQHLTFPNNFNAEQETTISQLVSLANDPMMKAIIMNQAVPGCTEGFRRVREIRPDIKLLAAVPYEDPLVISKAADLIMRNDFVSAGYRVIWASKQLGAKTFVHISFPRHMSVEPLTRRRMIMEQACKDLGVKFVFETAPDPLSDVGVVGAQQYLLENVPKWVKKYGKNTSFYATNDAHTEPLIRQIVQYRRHHGGGQPALAAAGLPRRAGHRPQGRAGQLPGHHGQDREGHCRQGRRRPPGHLALLLPGRDTVGLVQHAMNVVEGKSKMTDMKDIFKAFGMYTPGTKWAGSYYIDGSTGVKVNNFVMLLQDTYIFGKGYIHSADIVVPEKYLKISSGLKKKA